MSSGGAAGRRDTPAARAALARRRQRAAQSLRPAPTPTSSMVAASTTATMTTSSVADDSTATSRPPTGIASPPRPRPANPASTTAAPAAIRRNSGSSAGGSTIHNKPKLTVDTTPPPQSSTARTQSQARMHSKSPSRERTLNIGSDASGSRSATNASPSRMRPTQLTRRAHDKRKSPSSGSTMDATLTTAALTTSTAAASPEQSISPLAYYTGTTSISRSATHSTAATTPQQALSNSQQAADQANSILNAVNARSRYHHVNSPKKGGGGVDEAPPIVASAGAASRNKAASPSRLAQQEDLLAASKRRRQTLESRHRLTVNTTHSTEDTPASAANTNAAVTTTTTSVLGAPPVAATNKAMNNPRYLRGASKSPSPIRNRTVSPSSRPATTTSKSATSSDSPLLARLQKLDLSDASQKQQRQRHQQEQQSQRVRSGAPPSPSQMRMTSRPSATSSVSPRRFQQAETTELPPPSPRRAASTGKSPRRQYPSSGSPARDHRTSTQQHVQERPSPYRQQPQQQRLQTRPRTPSPNRRTTSSSWLEKTGAYPEQRRRPTPIQTSREPASPGGRTSLQVRAMEARSRGRSSSPRDDPQRRPEEEIRQQQPNINHHQQKQQQQQQLHSSPYHSNSNQQQSHYHSNSYRQNNTGRNSPGVGRLSEFLMDTSVAEASTIADMTMHQMETPPRNNNNNNSMRMSFGYEFEASSPMRTMTPASPTLGAQPLYTPNRRQQQQQQQQQQEIESADSDNGDHFMTMATSYDQQTPTSNRYAAAYRPVDDFVENDDDDDEDQATLDPGKVQTIDSACLQSGSTILLRSYSQPTTVGIEQTGKGDGKAKESLCLAALTGQGLGRDEEVLTILKVISMSEGNPHRPRDTEDVTPTVRHGDTVMLYSAAAGKRALGSRKFVNSTGTASKLELGFFSGASADGAAGNNNKAEIWTILKARPDREVLVGRAVLAAASNPTRSKDYSSSASASGSSVVNDGGFAMPAPVRSSDPILLRNCYNGGILSVDLEGKLVLLTDSYQHQQQQQRYADDPTLLGQLQHHDRLYPTPNDTFQMIFSSIPPCPPWVAARSMDERIYSTGSYLLQPRRNHRSAEFESRLFGGNSSHISPILEATQRYVPSDENLSPKTKERILMDEVIGSFLGLEGRHVRLKAARGHTSSMDHFEFQLFEAGGVSFDAGLRHLVEQILPLSTSFVRVRNFVSSRHPGYEYGRVMQAFCEALDALLQDYVHFVSQLEWEFRKYSKSDTLTMKSIYFQITPSLHSMSILEDATGAVCESKGGELINALWSLDKQNYMGDSVAKKVLGILLDRASEPYMDMLSDWLQTGKLNDPYDEFMVKRGDTRGRGPFDGDSWLELFQINDDHVVQGIAPNSWTKDKIITTGKYWNAVQECRLDLNDHPGPTKQSKIPKLPFNSDSSAIASFIDSKYQSASKVLVHILMEHFMLAESLEIMKRYFLIDQGEFLAHFLDAAEEELLKPQDEISMGRLQHWLNTSVQLTEAHKEEWDPISGTRIPSTSGPLFPAGLRCRLSEETLVGHLDSLYGGGIADQGPVTPSRRAYGTSFHGPTGIEVFTIDFPRVPFPISLLLSQKAMSDYKLLFRHLFFTKHVERRLIAVWRDHQLLKKLDTLRGLLGPTFLLRQRMLHFIQNLIYYMVFEVVESHWMAMRNAIDNKSWGPSGRSDKQQTVDDILEVHNNFLKRTLEACLLTNSDLVRSLTKLMNTCLLFTDQMKRFMDTTKIHDDSLTRAAEKRGVVQRNLNERSLTQGQLDKRALRKALASTKEERQAIHNRQTRRVGREVNSDSYQRMVRRFDEVFNQDLANFMRQLNKHTSSGIVANLGIRLDYNGFVTATIAKNNVK